MLLNYINGITILYIGECRNLKGVAEIAYARYKDNIKNKIYIKISENKSSLHRSQFTTSKVPPKIIRKANTLTASYPTELFEESCSAQARIPVTFGKYSVSQFHTNATQLLYPYSIKHVIALFFFKKKVLLILVSLQIVPK